MHGQEYLTQILQCAIYESEENLRSLAKFLIGEDIGDIEIRNVDPVIFGNKENDLAFICNESIYIMMEEQSYHCANIAYRILDYSGIKEHG